MTIIFTPIFCGVIMNFFRQSNNFDKSDWSTDCEI